jgi:hypothetical protein
VLSVNFPLSMINFSFLHSFSECCFVSLVLPEFVLYPSQDFLMCIKSGVKKSAPLYVGEVRKRHRRYEIELGFAVVEDPTSEFKETYKDQPLNSEFQF